MNNLKETIESLKVIRTETKTKVSDEVLFENAVKIFISDRITESKKSFPFNPLKKEVPAQEKKVNPATDKQKNLLKTLGYKEDISKLTKQEAFKLIDEMIPSKEKRK